MRFRYLAGLSLAVALTAPATASAQVLGTSVSGGTARNLGHYSLGYSFTVSDPFIVNYLGFWDYGNDGLAISHRVGIFNASGSTLISSATIAAGTGATLLDGFRLVPVTSFTLGIGTYQVLGTTGDEFYNLDGLLTNAAGIHYVESSWCPSETLRSGCGFPTFNNGYFGANFAGESTPEPGSIVLLGTGLVGLYGAVRRRRDKEV